MQWLRLLAWMPDHTTPTMMLFGWLPQAYPQVWPKKKVKGDVMRKDLGIGVEKNKWYEEAHEAQDRLEGHVQDVLGEPQGS